MKTGKTIMIVAGESSGDLHAGKLAEAIKEASPTVRLIGAGGEQMRSAGVELIVETTQHAVTGIVEVFDHLSFFRKLYRRLATSLKTEKPDAVVLVDFPDFNLRFAEEVRRHCIPIIYYISPQVWAWRKGRVKDIARLVTKMLVIFEFEEAVYKEAGVDVSFVGHPLMDVLEGYRRRDLRDELSLAGKSPVVGLLPGSRGSEIKRLLWRMGRCATIIRKRFADAQFLVACAPGVPSKAYAAIDGIPFIHQARGRTYDVMASSDILITASGTATIEAAIIGTPMAVTYVVNAVSLALFLPLIRINNFAMVNIVAGREIMPEFYQWRAKPDRIAGKVISILEEGRLPEMKKELAEVRRRLGPPGAARRAADEIMKILR